LRTLPEASVHCCVTSPPYFRLRSYGQSALELGVGEDLDDYVASLVEVFAELRRVLHPSGVLWLNLGDSYARSKQLLGVPWRVAFALQDDGWLLRSENIWHKSKCLPQSVRDRPSYAHETVFLLAKQDRYFFDSEAVREPSATDGRVTRTRRSVWTIPTASYTGAHCAVMPLALAEVGVLSGSSAHGCCPACGAPYARIVEKGARLDADYLRYCGGDARGLTHSTAKKNYGAAKAQDPSATKARILAGMRERRTVDWRPTCPCDAGAPLPATVIDPFCGAGTTGVAALKHGRRFIGIELYQKNLDQTRLRLAPLATPVQGTG
jgi:DNA modification methylase